MTDSKYHDPDFDAMSGRGMKARWVLTATLRLKTAAHFGGQGNSALDMPILRCDRTGCPLLPGTSLGGALRANLLDRLTGYGGESTEPSDDRADWKAFDQAEVAQVFGGSRADREGAQSPLIVFDSLGMLAEDSPATEVRDGVMIETASGIAADHKKFDFEVLPAGTAFEVRFDLLVGSDADEGKVVSLLGAALEGLANGDFHIGLRRSRGMGEVAGDGWTARRYDLATPTGWLDWISSDHGQSPDKSSTLSVSQAILSAIPTGVSILPIEDRRRRIVIDAEATILGDLLIRSPNAQTAGPDVSHLSSGGRPVLTGTSLAGVMRAQALRIARLVHDQSREAAEDRWITPLFGTREEGVRNPDFQPRGSRLRVSERSISGGAFTRQARVAIDRFTQGVVPPALFDEQPQVGGTVALRFELRNPRDGEIGLLLLVLKDLLTGQLPVGGSSSVGRGVLAGRRLQVSGTGIPEPIEVTFDPTDVRRGRVPTDEGLSRLVQQFVESNAADKQLQGAGT